MFTLVGAGLTTIESSERLMPEVLPRHCVLYQAKVDEFDPEANRVKLSTGEVVNEPLRQKTNNLGFRSGPTQTGLCNHRERLGEGMYYLRSENKGVDQLCSYCK